MNSKLLHLIICLIVSSILASPCFSVVYVDQNAPGPEHNGLSWDTAFLTLQEGMDAATPSGEVWVADGVYVENVVMGEGVRLYGGFLGAEPGGYEDSLDQRDFVNNVATIDGNQSGSCVVMAVEARVDGFTITNGSGTIYLDNPRGGGFFCLDLGETGVIANNTIVANTADDGGGLCLRAESSPAIIGNTISDNTAAYHGGAVSCRDESSPVIEGNTITGNGASLYGGGIFCYEGSSPRVVGNTISDNEISFVGAGIFFEVGCSSEVIGNTFSGNWSKSRGGAIYCGGCSPTISGNTITGNSALRDGGGILCQHGATPTIGGNTISQNSTVGAGGSGGGICCEASSPTIVCNAITGNSTAGSGGGIRCEDGASPIVSCNTVTANSSAYGGGGICCFNDALPILADNVIAGNCTDRRGGGVYCVDHASPALTNNTIWGNSAGEDGGGIGCYDSSSPSVSNNIVTENSANEGGGGIWCSTDSTPSLSHNDFWGNTPGDYHGSDPGEGDISADPLLVDPGNGDFHLSPESPCIDAGWNEAPGLPRTDFEGDLRVLDGNGDETRVVDIGADEFAPQEHVVAVIDKPAQDVTIDEDTPIEFAGTAYHTGDLAIVDYLWTFGEGSGLPDSHVEDPGVLAYDEPGVYVVTFNAQAEDGSWCANPDTRTITVLLVAPEAVIDSPESSVYIDPGDYVLFEGTATDGNGEIVDWLWTFGEGSGIADSHVEDPGLIQFNNPGTFKVVFSAQDDEGNWDPKPDWIKVYVWGGPIKYVDRDSPGPYHTGVSWDTAYLEIRDGLQAARPGDEVWVAEGTYEGTLSVNDGVSMYGGFLGAEPGGYETSLDERDYRNNVAAIVGSPYNACLMLRGADLRVDGFTITGSTRGGISCNLVAEDCVIANNVITGNGAEYGGIHCRSGTSPTIVHNTIYGNWTGGQGGGVLCDSESSPTIANNIIASNQADLGGGVCCAGASPILTNNTLVGNSATVGGGVWCRESSPTLSNNAVIANSAVAGGGGIQCEDSSPVLSHNDFWGNSPRDYSGCDPGEGDISADPMFVDLDNGNWHLSFGSPCIDAGTNYAPELPEIDWEGEPRVYDGDGDQEEPAVYATVDMGADEFVPFVAVAPDPQPECDGPLFGLSQAGLPAWVWFSIPLDPDSCCNGGDCYSPATVLGFPVSGRLWRWDKYAKTAEVYKAGFTEWDMAVGEGYLLFLWTDVPNPSYLGISPFTPWTFEHKLGRQGWTWIGMPGLSELSGPDFMSSVKVKYPSDETGAYRTAAQDYGAIPGNWITWGWPFWNTWRQGAATFTPYAPFGHNTCYPWVGYRVWINVGSAAGEDDPDQVTLVWPRP